MAVFTTLMRIILIGFAVIASLNVYSEQVDYSAKQWLEKMTDAASTRNYQGVLIYGNQQVWETLKVMRANIDGQEYEKMLYLTGEPREFIRRGNQLTCIHPDTRMTQLTKQSVQSPLSKNLNHGLTQLGDIYDTRISIQERIAGRMAQKISLIPKDSYRYGYHFWLDTQSALLLRSDMLEQDKVLERFQFAQIRIDLDLPKLLFEPEIEGHLIEDKLSNQIDINSMSDKRSYPQWIPKGFKVFESKVQSKHRKPHGIKLMYSDGFNYFSVFIEPSVQSLPEIKNKWGTTSATVVYKENKGQIYKITVVGELPIEAIKKVAQSVSFNVNES